MFGENWLKTAIVKPLWYLHGGKETIDSYDVFSEEDKKEHLSFFENMPLYHLDEENRLFLHAGFTSVHGVEKEIFTENFYFDRTLWELVLAMNKNMDKDAIHFPKRLQHYSEIYIGHTPTTNFGETKPMNAFNVWNIDTGAAFKGKITGINIDTKRYFQSDNLPDLYPNEKGRNK